MSEQQLSPVCSEQVMGQCHGNELIEVVAVQWQALRTPMSCCYNSTDFALEDRKKVKVLFCPTLPDFRKSTDFWKVPVPLSFW